MQKSTDCHRPVSTGFSPPTKRLLTMRLAIIILTIGAMHIYATGHAQSITYSGKNVTLKQVFSVIKEQTGYVVLSDNEVMENSLPVTILASSMPLNDFLNLLLKGQSLTFTIHKKTIFIKKVMDQPAPPASKVLIQVTDSSGAPLVGATIEVHGEGAYKFLTDEAGKYALPNLFVGDTIRVTYVGYKHRVLVYKGGDRIFVVLQITSSSLDKVVIQAYGTTTKRFSVGSISTVTSDLIEKQPVTNLLQSLQGLVPGLNVVTTNGAPAQGP